MGLTGIDHLLVHMNHKLVHPGSTPGRSTGGRQTERKVGMYLKARSLVEDAPAARKRWMIEVAEYAVQKFFPQSYEEMTEHIRSISSEYRTPLVVPQLMEGYDWTTVGKRGGANVWGLFQITQPNDKHIIAVLSNAVVFIMNDKGDTIDRANV